MLEIKIEHVSVPHPDYREQYSECLFDGTPYTGKTIKVWVARLYKDGNYLSSTLYKHYKTKEQALADFGDCPIPITA